MNIAYKLVRVNHYPLEYYSLCFGLPKSLRTVYVPNKWTLAIKGTRLFVMDTVEEAKRFYNKHFRDVYFAVEIWKVQYVGKLLRSYSIELLILENIISKDPSKWKSYQGEKHRADRMESYTNFKFYSVPSVKLLEKIQ